jgi:superfamily II DNA or RNA helicase
MSARTYGQYRFDNTTGARGSWLLDLEPAAAIRAKRVFGRVQQGRTGTLVISHTIEVARDIEWFMQRWPLKAADRTSAGMLAESAVAHREQEIAVGEVLDRPPRLKLDAGTLLKTPYPYQVKSLELLRVRHRILVTDEVGLGKTLTGLLNLTDESARPAVIVPPTHLPPRWVTELNESMPWLTVEVAKKTRPPQHIIDGDFPDVVIVPYSKLAGWRDALAGRVRSVIFDEVQELRNGTSTDKGFAAAHVAAEADFVMGLTATPVYNYGGEVWAIFNIIAPGELGTAIEFTREWGHVINNGHIHVAQPAALGSYLREKGLMIGHTREEVGHDLPKAIKVPQFVDADPKVLQKVAGDAAAMARLILSNSGTREERWRASGDLDWKMREATGIAKAPYVAEFVRLLLESEEKVALFGWHRAVWDLWQESLREFHPVMYTGTESPTQKAAAEEEFKNGRARIMMMSLRSGSGIDGLQKVCSVAVFGELDWSPQVHEQAIGRFRRDGMDENKPVVAYFLHSTEGSDPPILEALQIKRNQAEPLVSKDGKLLDNAIHDVNRSRALAEAVLKLTGHHTPAADPWAAPTTAPAARDALTPLWEETNA